MSTGAHKQAWLILDKFVPQMKLCCMDSQDQHQSPHTASILTVQ